MASPRTPRRVFHAAPRKGSDVTEEAATIQPVADSQEAGIMQVNGDWTIESDVLPPAYSQGLSFWRFAIFLCFCVTFQISQLGL